jgi:hypothetical protein
MPKELELAEALRKERKSIPKGKCHRASFEKEVVAGLKIPFLDLSKLKPTEREARTPGNHEFDALVTVRPEER